MVVVDGRVLVGDTGQVKHRIHALAQLASHRRLQQVRRNGCHTGHHLGTAATGQRQVMSRLCELLAERATNESGRSRYKTLHPD